MAYVEVYGQDLGCQNEKANAEEYGISFKPYKKFLEVKIGFETYR